MTIIGIDPGEDAGAVFINMKKDTVTPCPYSRDWEEFQQLVLRDDCVAFVEEVWSSSNQGHMNAFTFGGNFKSWGTALNIHAIPTVLVLPAEWQDPYDVSGLAYGKRKTALHKISQKKYGKHDRSMADAYLIAEYGVKNYARFFDATQPSFSRNRKRVSLGF